MLKYPNRDYKDRDNILVECDVTVSPYCKRFYIMRNKYYRENLKRNDNVFMCRACSLLIKSGVETIVEFRKKEDILLMNHKRRGRKYKMKNKPRKKFLRAAETRKRKKRT